MNHYHSKKGLLLICEPTSSQSASEQFSITLVWYVTPNDKKK